MAKPSVGIDFKMGRMFFDREEVIKATERKERRVLSKAGAFVRRSARASIRRRKRGIRTGRGQKLRRSSNPGNPPISWTSPGEPGIKAIFFEYDPQGKRVVVGPSVLNSKEPVPDTLELGGTANIWQSRNKYASGSMWTPGKWRGRNVENRRRRVKIEPRPFLGPALEDNESAILDLFESEGF